MTRRTIAAASAALAGILALTTAVAAGPGTFAFGEGPGVVELVDGRALEVAALRDAGDGHATLELPGGGTMVFPASIVARWTPAAAAAAEPAAVVVGPAEAPLPAWAREAGELASLIEAAAARNRLHPELLAAVARVESGFDTRAVSPKGAGGVLQLMPATAERFGVRDRFDAAQNVEAGARYLSWLLDRYRNRLDLALAGYNAGENAVDRYSGVPPYRETLHYVHKVLEHAARYGLETRQVR